MALSMLRAGAAYVPVPLTGFNDDVIASGVGAASAATTADVDATGTGYVFISANFQQTSTSTLPTNALPNSGLITSAATSGLTFQLASYTGNNACRLTSSHATDSLLFVTPQSFAAISFLATSGNGASSVNVTINFTDGTSQATTSAISVLDWFQNTLPANTTIAYIGRALRSSGALEAQGSGFTGPNLYEYNIALQPANYAKLIRSVVFNRTSSSSGAPHIMAITGSTLCSGAVTAGTIASTTGTSVCPSVSFNLSLPSATTGGGITYQWQSSATGGAPWTDIASATGTSYAATQTAATSYRAYVVCPGSSSDTSAPITVSIKPANQCYCIPPANTISNTPCSSTDYIQDFYTTGALSNIPSTPGCVNVNYIDRTNITVAAVQGTTVNFTLVNGSTAEGYKIWVDWNQNGSFTDAGELVYGGTSVSANTTVNNSFQVPATAVAGLTRMRVRTVYNNTTFDPCTAYGYGQSFDYSFNVVPNVPCAAPTSQATALVLASGVTVVNINYTAASPAADKYLILRTPGTAAPTVLPTAGTSYTAGATLGNATVVSAGTNAVSVTDPTASPSTTYRYTVYTYNDLCVGGPIYNTTAPLTGTTTTAGTTTYTWNGSVSTDYQVAGNWTPARSVLDPTDILQFNNGITDSVTNVPTQTIGRLAFSNNTLATFKAQTGATRTLTLNSDGNAATNELDIAAGSSLISLGTANALAIKFAGTGGTGRIAGSLEVSNTGTAVNTVDFTNTIDTVTGTLAAGGSLNGNVFTSTAASLTINGTYNHRYTTVGGGNIPTATWGPASNVLISGYTTATGGPAGGLGQTFNDFTYNAPNQTANSQWSGTLPGTVNGTLSVLSTGTGQWLLATTSTYTLVTNNYLQSGGTVDLGTGTGAKTMIVNGNFNQSAGILKASGAGAVTLNFNGNGTQNVSFADSAVNGPIIYRVSNPGGINLNGTGLLASSGVFKINSGGGVQITTSAVTPVNTAMTLSYAATGTTLTYDGSQSQTIATAVWPVANGPLNLTINNSGTDPANRVALSASRSIAGTVTISNGVLVLGSSNLTISNNASGAISITTPGAGKMISADGTGQLIRAIGTTASTTYLFPVGDLTGTAEYSPASLTYSSTGARLVGVRVVNAHHPNDASTTYLNRYWNITDTATSAYTYSGSFGYTAADITGAEVNLRINTWNGTAWTQVPSLPNSGVLTIQGTQSGTTLPIGNMQVTGRTAVRTTYTWNGSVSTDYQVAGNWTPARNLPDPGDVLLFNNAIVDTVKNIPTQTISRLVFSNNTTGIFQTSATNTLTFVSDNVTTTDELDIAAGSTLSINTPSTLNLAFTGTGGTANIAGVLDVVNVGNTVNPSVNFTNAIATVTSTGTISAGAAATSGANNFVSTAANLLISGTYNHKFTVNSGGGIPTATWNTGSTVLISGYTTSTGGPNGGLGQTFYNFTYNCPNQTSANNNWSGPNPLNITGTLSIVSTGAGTWQYSGTSSYALNVGNYSQTGGIFDLSSGNTTSSQVMSISGTFSKTGGTLKATNTTGQPTLKFTGTTAQNVTFDAAPGGRIVYWITNPAGINLNGTGSLTTFAINDGGGMRISTTAANPVTTTMTLTYAGSSTLTYDPSASVVATANVWPATNGPANVTINNGASTNTVGVPFNRTISGTLNMTSGDLDLGANTLTLGTAPGAAGTLTYTAGSIRVTTGAFTRYYGTSGLPTSPGTGVGFYPLASSNGVSRNVSVYFSAAGALSTGGSISVGHNGVNGLTPVTVTDGAYNITTRTNASWNFTATGLVLSGTNTAGIRLTGTALFTAINPANLRVMQPAAVVGTHVAGAGATAQRSGLTVADLTNTYHIGANGADMAGTYIAINTGNWSTPATWLNNLVPGVANDAYINPGVTVSADAATNTAKSLMIFPGATLNVNSAAATVTLDSMLQNNGTVTVNAGSLTVNASNGISGITNSTGAGFTVSGGTVNLGPAGGSNKPFTNNGTMTVSGGTVNINGNINCVANSVFNQSGGDINVDGNAGSNAANSVASGTAIVSFKSQFLNLTGGNLTIIDPHPNSSATNTFEYSNSTAHVNVPATHTLILGNGVSTDTSANTTNGFRLNTWPGSNRISFGKVIVNGTGAANRFVSNTYNTGINGDLIINNGGEFRMNSGVYVNGNLTVNTGGTLTTNGNGLVFATFLNGSQGNATAAQVVSGAGTFRNTTSAPTANFNSVTVQNANGVTFNTGGDVSFSGTTTFTAAGGPSRIIMTGTNRYIEIGGASISGNSQTNGWLVGRYQKTAGSTGAFNGTLPVGDANYYAPVVINNGTVATAGAIWASTSTPDHPSIGTAAITAAKSVNRYYTIQRVNGLTFSAGTVSATLNWNAADVDAGAATANFKVGRYANSTWLYPATASAAATSIQMTGLDTAISGDFAVGEACSSPINVTTPPANQTVCLGSPVTFTVGLAGNSNVTYQWQKGTTNISGATGATYTITASTLSDTGTYRVVVSSVCPAVSSVTSVAATLTVNTPASISTQPVAQSVCEGNPATFSVTAAGTGLTYQWLKGGSNIPGATSASYTIPSVSAADAAGYSVVVSGAAPCGSVTSAVAALTVKALPRTITAAGTTSFCPGGSVSLCAGTVPANLTYQWYQNGSPLPGQTNACYTATTGASYRAMVTNPANGCSDTTNSIVVNTSGAPQSVITPANAAAFCQGSTITLHGLSTAGLSYKWFLNGDTTTAVGTDSTLTTSVTGSYTLRVSIGSGCSTTSTPTVVSVNPLPVITTVPAGNQTICQNDTLTLTAFYNNATLVWKLNGGAIPGATGNTYRATTGGNYTVTATSTTTGCQNTSAIVSLVVNPLPTVTVTSANAATFCDGGADTLKASPTTGLTYLWYRNGTQIAPAATGSSYAATQTGSYTVVATSTATGCSRTSTATSVTVNPLPNVVVTPSLGLNICQGQTTNLCVPATTGVTYAWKLGTAAIPGATSACYAASTAGSYSVTATNTATGCSATSAVAAVTVNPVPAATATPRGSTTICQGDTLWIDGNNGANLTYQWRFNTNPIVGATSASYPATASGAYTVTVTNGSNCSATSAIVNVTVNARPTATITYTTPITFCQGGAVVLTGVSNTGITYQWQNNGAAIPGAINNNYIATTTGNYSVIITNGAGCSTVSQPVVVVVNPTPAPVITRSGSILSTGTYSTYQWYYNSQPIPGATNQSYNATQNGGYAVFVTDANNCTNYSQVYFYNSVGVNGPLLNAAAVKVFPNPVRNLLNIEAPSVVNVIIRDLTGREVLRQDNARQIDMSKLADGAYMLMISDKNGNMIKTDKVMKVAE